MRCGGSRGVYVDESRYLPRCICGIIPTEAHHGHYHPGLGNQTTTNRTYPSSRRQTSGDVRRRVEADADADADSDADADADADADVIVAAAAAAKHEEVISASQDGEFADASDRARFRKCPRYRARPSLALSPSLSAELKSTPRSSGSLSAERGSVRLGFYFISTDLRRASRWSAEVGGGWLDVTFREKAAAAVVSQAALCHSYPNGAHNCHCGSFPLNHSALAASFIERSNRLHHRLRHLQAAAANRQSHCRWHWDRGPKIAAMKAVICRRSIGQRSLRLVAAANTCHLAAARALRAYPGVRSA